MTDFATLGIRAETSDLRTARDELRGLTRDGAETEQRVGGSMNRLAGHWGRMAAAAGAAIGAIAGAVGFSASIREAEQYELRLNRINAILRATGGVAGRTSQQLQDQAQALARATLESVDGVMQAQQVLLTFRNVQGEVFDRAIESAADLAAAMGGDVVSATRQIARALEDPIQGVTALTRSGTVFTQQQRDMIRAMVEAGNTAGAQALILSELEGQYGGAARAVPRLSAAQDSLGQSMGNLRRAISDSTGAARAWAAVIETTDSIVQAISDNIDSFRGYIIAAAAAATIYYIPAVFAATVQTGMWIAALITLRGALLATGVGALIVGAGILINYFIRLIENTGSWGEAMSILGEVVSGVWDGIMVSAKAIRPALAAIWAGIKVDFFDMLADIVDAWQEALRGFGANLQLMRVVPGIGGALGIAGDALAGLQGGEGLRGRATRAHSDQLIAEFERDRISGAGFDMAREALARLNETLARNDDLTTESADAARELAAELDGIAGEGGGGGARGAAAAVDALADSVDVLRDAAQQVENSFESAFVNFVTGTQSAREAISNLLQDLSRLWAQAAFQSLFGGAFGSGGALSFLIPGRAVGGPVAAGHPYLVNENTPNSEVFVPSASGAVLNVPQAQAALRGGGGQRVIINNYTGAPVQEQRSTGPDAEELVTLTIGRAVSKGKLDKQFGGRYGSSPQRIRR